MEISPGEKIYFEEFTVDLERRVILRDAEHLALNPKAFDLLIALIDAAGSLVTKDDLLERVWPDQFVEENNLTVHVSALRKVLGENKSTPRFIITVPGRGYKFIGQIRSGGAVDVERPGSAAAEQLRGSNKPHQPTSTPYFNRPTRAIILIVPIFVLGAVVALVWWATRPSPDQQIKSVAILPFKPLVADNRDEALELGMSDSLISGFSRIRTINVSPITAVRRYAALDQDAVTAGRELGVESVLDGSIQRIGERIRVSARLMRVRDGATLWTETFDENFTDIFAVQDSIAQQIVGALALRLSGDQQTELAKRYTENTEAYQLYVKGRFFWSKLTPDGLHRSVDFYNTAIELDPAYALAYAGLADSYNLMGSYGLVPIKESHPRARSAAEKAIALDPKLAEAHASLATVIADYYWDWDAAERHFRRSIELDPNYPVARNWYSQHLSRMGRFNEAIEEAKRAQMLDPISSSAYGHLGLALYRARRYDDALIELRKGLDLDPRALDIHIFLGLVLARQGDSEEAIRAMQTAVDVSEQNPSLVLLLGYAYASGGKSAEARAILKEMDVPSKGSSEYPFETALIYMGLGDHDRSFEWFERAYAERSWQMGFLGVEPLVDPLRSDPRFAPLLQKLDLEESIAK
jgi:DNA-binding winged helix-turn-helix (wHTH) protein/TolB-like protein/Flp pilus assembly protein TadD